MIETELSGGLGNKTAQTGILITVGLILFIINVLLKDSSHMLQGSLKVAYLGRVYISIFYIFFKVCINLLLFNYTCRFPVK